MQSPFDSPLSGFRSPFGGRRLGFSVAALFTNGEQGVLFEPSPDTCFTDTAGTTPAGVGDAVALMLDGSQGAGYRNGEFTRLGPELVTNGTFDSDISGWSGVSGATVSFNTGRAEVDIANFSGSGITSASDVQLLDGKSYCIEADIEVGSYTGESVNFVLLGVIYGPFTVASTGVTTIKIISEPANQSITTAVRINRGTADTGTIFVDNVSVRELPGNHATQPTAAARPILARVPDGGRRNLLTRTEEFDNAVWTRIGSSSFTKTANTTAAPFVSEPDVYIYALGENGGLFQDTEKPVKNNTNYTSSVWIKANKPATLGLRANGTGTVDNQDINITTEWVRHSVSRVSDSTAGRFLLDNRVSSGYGTTGLEVALYGAQLEEVAP